MPQAATVLVADNDEEALRRQEEALRSEGFNVLTAAEPEEAKRVLQTERVDVAVVDIRLDDDNNEGDTSGMELAESETPGVSKVLVTVWPEPAIVKRAQKLKDQYKIVDFVEDKKTDIMLKAVWKAVAHRNLVEALVARGALMTGTARDESVRFTLRRRRRAVVAALFLLFALGAGLTAVVTEEAKWLFGTITSAAVMVIFVGWSMD